MGQTEKSLHGISQSMDVSAPEKAESTKTVASGKRTYASPKLVTYGDIREITLTLNSLMGNPDGMVIGPLILKTGGF